MKAIWYEQSGPATDVLQYGEVDSPGLNAGEVRVRVKASGINPSDTKFRSGWMGLKQPYPRTIPHNDGAGVIEAVGDGVALERVGEKVWIYEAQRGQAYGTAAEYVVIPAHKAVPMPKDLDFAEGASLGVPAMTAHFLLFSDGSIKDQTVLIHGGAGAVGIYAIQLAKWGGAQVITTISNDEKAAVARHMGADHIINYRTENVKQRVIEITDNRRVDRIADVALAANIQLNTSLIRPNGVIAAYESGNSPHVDIPFYDLLYKNATLRTVLVYAMNAASHQAAIKDIHSAIAVHALKHRIAARFRLEDAAIAHEAVEQGQFIGKVVLDLE